MVNAQQWLNKQYPPKERKGVIRLNVWGKNLEGSLKLEQFVNLEFLNCSHNHLIHLEISNCPNLKELWCSNNNLTSLDLKKNNKLEEIWIYRNKFSRQNLSFLSHLVNLKWLNLEGNYFVGSLEELKNMTKLKGLFIANTRIEGGLEYLSDDIERFSYCPKENVKGNSIEQELRKYGKVKDNDYSLLLSKWKQNLVNRELTDSLRLLFGLELVLKGSYTIDPLAEKVLQIVIFETQEKIIAWRKGKQSATQTQILISPRKINF